MKDMLYIDGRLVDLGEGVDITLNYKSNMLTDLSKIVGNNSYTIKLPKTMRNLGIIGISDIPSVVSSFPRVAHDARYFRNGIEIISEGKAVLMGVSDAIEVVLTWGISSAVFKMVDDSRNMNEFPNVDDYIMWEATNTASPYDGTSEIINAEVKYGLVPNDPLAVIHPSVRSTYIFKLLSKMYDISFDFPEERMPFINSLIVPLLTRNGGYANSHRSKASVAYNELTGDYVINKVGDDFDSNFEYIPYNGREYLFVFRVKKDGKVTVRPSFWSARYDKGVYYGTDNYEDNIEYFPYKYDNSGERVKYIYDEAVEVELKKDDVFGVNLMNSTAQGMNNTYFEFEFGVSQVQIGDKFPIVENLPSITPIDFVKAIAVMTGMFCVPSSDGSVIKFVPFEYLSKRESALDWSDKLIPQDYNNRPRSLSYALDDFAQRNHMLYEEDDTVNLTIADGIIFVNDATLDKDRDAVTLPFAASDMGSGKAIIRLYEYSDDGKPELQSVEPRILIERDIRGLSTGVFDGLQWPMLLGKYYETYQKAVRTPVVITEKIMLDELSLKDLDVSVPVYLRQYGKYYAVVELKAPSSGVCECKLLQLED